MKKIVILILCILGIITGIVIGMLHNKTDQVQEVSHQQTVLFPSGEVFNVILAETPQKREKGLSGKETLMENEGMLFIFEQEGLYPFWMKDMNFPIDIIWMNEQGVVVYVEKDLQTDSYPQTFVSTDPALYVLEVSSGMVIKNNIEVGKKIIITR